MLGSVDGTVSAEENRARIASFGVSINRVESVALAIAYLMNEGPKSNGKGILVQADRMVDLEQGYAKSRETLMGAEMLELLKQGLKAELYPRIKSPAKL